jgi:hypothetical protein
VFKVLAVLLYIFPVLAVCCARQMVAGSSATKLGYFHPKCVELLPVVRHTLLHLILHLAMEDLV